jgi:hypothetical protein
MDGWVGGGADTQTVIVVKLEAPGRRPLPPDVVGLAIVMLYV